MLPTNPLLPPQLPATPPPPPREASFLKAHKLQLTIGMLAVFLLANLAVSAWLFHKVSTYSTLSAVGLKKATNSSSTFDGDNTLYIDTKNKSVGVGAASPEGLQVDSNITSAVRGGANIRVGLLNGSPALILEDQKAQQAQLGISNGALQLSAGGAVFATASAKGFNINSALDVQANTTLGSSAKSSITFQAGALAIPNNLNIGNNALFINSGGGVAIGTTSTAGYKLYIAGNTYNSGSFQSGGQVLVPAKNAATPSIGFSGDSNTGLFSPSSNIVSLSAGGTETLRVAPGDVSTQNGANLDIAGFLQAGAGGPSFKVARYTGKLDGSGTQAISHGISNAPRRVLIAMGWYESTSGQAKFLSVDYIDNSHMQVSGGVPGSAWRGVIVYTSDIAGW